ncbi:MAG: transcriptional regulator [Gammaproteobacteria bacterium]|nr:transcriptional regulator [Gammaproteobacteria bacterium]MBU1653640.1 transcriptional regulator [Gammaproteobacteria bacterium]MBU1962752.1 transcriptional regulator [Gammaproteobacteria bacterium]
MNRQTAAEFEGRVQPWGNSLGLRITKAVSELAHLEKGALVSIEVTGEGLVIRRKAIQTGAREPYSEAELLAGLTAYLAHADELPSLIPGEQGD